MEIPNSEGVKLHFVPETDHPGTLYFAEMWDLCKQRDIALERHDVVAHRKACRNAGLSKPSQKVALGLDQPEASSKCSWRMVAVKNCSGRCLCDAATKWSYYVLDPASNKIGVIGEYCLRKALPELLGDARTLKHYYRTGICADCRSKAAQTDMLCADCAKQTETKPCSKCNHPIPQTKLSKKHEMCLTCWNRDQLEQSQRSCPRCNSKIPLNKTWWVACYECFLKEKGRQRQSQR